MTQSCSRREFFGTSFAGLMLNTVALRHGMAANTANPSEFSSPNARRLGWEVALPLYTFRSISFYEALPKIAQLGVQHVEPAFFLKLDSSRPDLCTSESLTASVRQEMKRRMADFGITMSTYYAEFPETADEAKRVFDFAKEMGVRTIVAEPPEELLDSLEPLCEQHQLNIAIHNHPKAAGYKYWDPENVLKACRGRSSRIGACCDTGHWVRSGLPVLACLKKMKGRILTLHLKDVAERGNPQARDVPLGTGLAGYPQVLKELHEQRFHGIMTVEYEHESERLLEELRQCLALVENTARQIDS
jgi:sugar phosphate isomerase/epimerase